MCGLQETAKQEFGGLGVATMDYPKGQLGGPPMENDIFSGHFFQDNAAARKEQPIYLDLVGIFAPMLDCQMTQHKLDSEIHQQRCDELRRIAKEGNRV